MILLCIVKQLANIIASQNSRLDIIIEILNHFEIHNKALTYRNNVENTHCVI